MTDLAERDVWKHFLLEHYRRFAHVPLPPLGSEAAEVWRATREDLVDAGVELVDLEQASKRLVVLCSNERQHYQLLYDVAVKIRNDRRPTAPARWRPDVDPPDVLALEEARRVWDSLMPPEVAARVEDVRRRVPWLDPCPGFCRELAIAELGLELREVAHAPA